MSLDDFFCVCWFVAKGKKNLFLLSILAVLSFFFEEVKTKINLFFTFY